jgi:hypothetical protein
MTLIQWVGAGTLAIAAFGATLYFQGRGKSRPDGVGDSSSGHHGGGHAGDPSGGDSGGGSD